MHRNGLGNASLERISLIEKLLLRVFMMHVLGRLHLVLLIDRVLPLFCLHGHLVERDVLLGCCSRAAICCTLFMSLMMKLLGLATFFGRDTLALGR